LSKSSAIRIRTREEVGDAIRAFSPANRARLRSAARYFGLARGLDPDDLVQEGLMRAIDERNCPDNVSVVRFVVGIIRSIASGESDKLANQVDFIPIDHTGGATDTVLSIADEAEDAEAQLIAGERAEACRKMHGEIVALFADDQVALLVLEGMMDGMSVDEMLELTGLDRTAYDSKRKLIRRRISKKFTNGWKP